MKLVAVFAHLVGRMRDFGIGRGLLYAAVFGAGRLQECHESQAQDETEYDIKALCLKKLKHIYLLIL